MVIAKSAKACELNIIHIREGDSEGSRGATLDISQTRQCLERPPFQIRPEGTTESGTIEVFHWMRVASVRPYPKIRRPFRTGNSPGWLQTMACLANIRGRSATRDQTLACLAYIRRRSVTTDQTPIGDR